MWTTEPVSGYVLNPDTPDPIGEPVYPSRQLASYARTVPEAEYVPSARTQKVLAQLEAEIAAQRFSMKTLALQMGTPYVTFRRYVKGERSMPAEILLEALATLEVDPAVFMRRAAER